MQEMKDDSGLRASSRRLVGGDDRRHVLGPDVADMLVADDALAVDDEGLGHARRARGELDPAVGSAPIRCRTDRPSRRGRRRHPRAGRGSRRRRSARPSASEPSSCGASARQGTHQLAKTLTRRGRPERRSALARPGMARHAAAGGRNRASACRSSASGSRSRARRDRGRTRRSHRKIAKTASGTQRIRRFMPAPPDRRGARGAPGRSGRGSRRTRPSRRRARSG
jgi:hypothetical protein